MNFSRRFFTTGLCVVSLSAITAIAAVAWWRSANIGAVQRGADLARGQVTEADLSALDAYIGWLRAPAPGS